MRAHLPTKLVSRFLNVICRYIPQTANYPNQWGRCSSLRERDDQQTVIELLVSQLTFSGQKLLRLLLVDTSEIELEQNVLRFFPRKPPTVKLRVTSTQHGNLFSCASLFCFPTSCFVRANVSDYHQESERERCEDGIK